MRPSSARLVRVPVPVLLAGAFFLLTAGTLSRVFPPINTDEVVTAVHGESLLSGNGQRYSLYDDVFAESVYPLRDAFPDISKTLYNGWVGLWVHAFHRSFWGARFSSVAAGLMGLAFLYRVGRSLKGPALGAGFCVIAAINPIFLTASSVVRPEVVLFAFATFTLWMILDIASTWKWKRLAIGGLCGLSISVHQNAVPVALGLLTFYAMHESTAPLPRRLLEMAGGGLLGVLLALAPVDLFKFMLSQKSFYYELYHPPIFSTPWNPLMWLSQTFQAFLTGPTFYFQSGLAPGWTLSVVLCGAVMMGAAVLAVWRAPAARPFAVALLVTFCAMAALARRKEALYAMALYPFLIVIVGLYVMSDRRSILDHVARGVGGGLLMASSALFFRFAFDYGRLCVPYPDYTAQIKSLVGEGARRVVGPNILWFDRGSESFRDIGALVYSHWYTGGGQEMRAWLRPFQPDILVADASFKRAFFGPNAPDDAIVTAMGPQTRLIGAVETGAGADGLLEVYSLK